MSSRIKEFEKCFFLWHGYFHVSNEEKRLVPVAEGCATFCVHNDENNGTLLRACHQYWHGLSFGYGKGVLQVQGKVKNGDTF